MRRAAPPASPRAPPRRRSHRASRNPAGSRGWPVPTACHEGTCARRATARPSAGGAGRQRWVVRQSPILPAASDAAFAALDAVFLVLVVVAFALLVAVLAALRVGVLVAFAFVAADLGQ